MNMPFAIKQLLISNLNHSTYSAHAYRGKSLAYPLAQARLGALSICRHALEHTLQVHPLRLMVCVALSHPSRQGPLIHHLGHNPKATNLKAPTADSKTEDVLMRAYFDNLNYRLEKEFIFRRTGKFGCKPYHALTMNVGNYHTLVIFAFNRSEYRKLGRATSHPRYLQTQIRNAWADTIGLNHFQFDSLKAWADVGEQWEVNMKHEDKQSEVNAMHYQLSWLAHRSLGGNPVIYWRY
ncbi:YagK/YfjJ domain-containing protein [Vibrio gangliei]|uniref:YagK/YfjJ domain-containing protein n=1 Tax=Vibrio gangliei TaxID=2077090 RepID=UPI000D011F96|nr:inovirus-type Gp2 protein [Vibrio gangliei]